ncbi:MAG: hypothetical protein AB1744_10415, partial [Candidatus Zixiibacteriota bacterium]
MRSQESFPDCTNAAVTKGFVTAHEVQTPQTFNAQSGILLRAADVPRLSHKPVLLEINPIRVAAELVSAVEGTALGATQGRPLRDEKDE